MSKRPRRNRTPEQKAAILKRHHLDKVPVSQLCNENKLHSWCPRCAPRSRGSIDGMRALAAARGGRCLSNEYFGHKTVLLWQCVGGHLFKASGMAVKSGAWCPSCGSPSASASPTSIGNEGDQRLRETEPTLARLSNGL